MQSPAQLANLVPRSKEELAAFSRRGAELRRLSQHRLAGFLDTIEPALARFSRQLDAQQVAIDSLSVALSRLSVEVANVRTETANAPSAPVEPLVADGPDALDRTRRQLSSIDAALDRELSKPEPHPKVVQSLASAKATLAELERRLDGRPLPATVRATARPSRSRDPLPEPTPVEPEPAVGQ